MLIGSRLDTEITSTTCRLSFSGQIIHVLSKEVCLIFNFLRNKSVSLFCLKKKKENVKLFKRKQRIGKVQRILDENNLIGHGLFDKNADIKYKFDFFEIILIFIIIFYSVFLGLKVRHEVSGQIGTIQSAFGKGDKFKVYFQNGIGERKEDVKTSFENMFFLLLLLSGEEAIKARNASLILDYKKMINNDSSAATSSTKQKKLQQ